MPAGFQPSGFQQDAFQTGSTQLGDSITFAPAPPLTREAITYTQGIDYIQSATRAARSPRPVYRFTARLVPLTRTQAQCLSALYAYYQGATPFYWDGGEYGRLENYNLVGEGDGVTLQYYLANRYIGAGSISVQTLRRATGTTSVWATGFSIAYAPGTLVFANSINTIPVSGDDVLAKYGCVYRLNFNRNGIKIEEIAAGVYQAEVVMTENILG